MSIFNKFFKYKNSVVNNDLSSKYLVKANILDEEIVFNDNELVNIAIDGIIDTTSLSAIKKFKHNLEVLVKKTKEKGKIDNFMIIREDDFFPLDYEWLVSSNVCLERNYLDLTRMVRNNFALEKLNLIRNFNGIQLPVLERDLQAALAKVDKEIGSILTPTHFRSTKHFTVNTPLGVTGNYNVVATNRNFIILDNISAFLKSGYGYSISYHDAYLDVTHEGLPISKDAVILIEKNKYESIINDKVVFEHLKQRRVVLYIEDEKRKDGEWLAINMLLTELGVLPSQIGEKYGVYDNEVKEIIKNSIQNLAKDNGILFDKSHGGSNGHFTAYLDEKNLNHIKSVSAFVNFLKNKFPDFTILFTERSVSDSDFSLKIIEKIGTNSLLEAIEEYNSIVQKEFNIHYNDYKKDRKSITPEISDYFKKTVKRIIDYYNLEQANYSYETQQKIEEYILHFYQNNKVKEQVIAAKKIWEALSNTLNVSQESTSYESTNSLHI